MSKKYIIWPVLTVAIIIVAFFVVSILVKTAVDSGETPVIAENTENNIEENLSSGTLPVVVSAIELGQAEAGLIVANPPVAPAEHQIIYSNGAFAPASLVIKKGDKVTFYNVSGDFFWPASALHPTHKSYPGSDIDKCDTIEADKIFDACRQVSPGEDWSFIFTEVGSWPYHNHLRASENGVIIVEN